MGADRQSLFCNLTGAARALGVGPRPGRTSRRRGDRRPCTRRSAASDDARPAPASRTGRRPRRDLERASGRHRRGPRDAAPRRQRRRCGRRRLIRPRRRGARCEWYRRLRTDARAHGRHGASHVGGIHGARPGGSVTRQRCAAPARQRSRRRPRAGERAGHGGGNGARVEALRQWTGEVARAAVAGHSCRRAGRAGERRARDHACHGARALPEVSGECRALLSSRRGAACWRHPQEPRPRAHAARHCRQRRPGSVHR